TERCRESFLRALREFRHEGLPWWFGGDLEDVEQDFAAFVARKLAGSNRRTETSVPATHLWAVAGEEFVGRISIRHELNDALRVRFAGEVAAATRVDWLPIEMHAQLSESLVAVLGTERARAFWRRSRQQSLRNPIVLGILRSATTLFGFSPHRVLSLLWD